MTDSTTTASWVRIERWLAQLAPRTFAALAPPADRSAIAAAEQAVGRPFPESLTECLLRHDGTGDQCLLPPFWSLLDTRGIVETWDTCTQINAKVFGDGDGDGEEREPNGDDGLWWHSMWFPFAADGAANHLVIDQRQHRWVGRIGNADHELGCSFESQPMWASLPALLEATATALETGDVLDGCLPVVERAELRWEVL
ncbi:Cell wall assembly regulator SMI1 [Streptomyces sp. 3213]|uniref:SMI1/KNR4 family protein n=1 Tax=Streptomyces sp. 3213.3 TaxID=1855348 RepID=UPI000894A29D|nr:SMI1/KNR4 family protein [Streptomyces sp. 3213.3]SEC32086.1 Cell wall assembly regulator SMI1 [Streptomyces sp. 3213] [Streptomyces sp. 3213.3]